MLSRESFPSLVSPDYAILCRPVLRGSPASAWSLPWLPWPAFPFYPACHTRLHMLVSIRLAVLVPFAASSSQGGRERSTLLSNLKGYTLTAWALANQHSGSLFNEMKPEELCPAGISENERLSSPSPVSLHYSIPLSQVCPSHHHSLAIRRPEKTAVNWSFPGNTFWITTNSAHRTTIWQTLSIVNLSIFKDPGLEGMAPL